MKTLFLPALLFLGLSAAAPAQVVPTTPTKFDIKPVTGPTASAGATISPNSTKPTVRQTTYLTLSDLRQWKSTDGKTLMGKLIAWEETVTTTTSTPAPVADKPITNKPTVLKNNKARLLVDNKAFEVPLDRLGAEEQKFIQQLHTRLTAKP
jgi:hypothetical protein